MAVAARRTASIARLPTELLVLAGGFGTRLRATVPDLPKPLAPVAGRPFLQHLIEHWVRQGIERFTFLLHHQAAQIEAFLDHEQRAGALAGCMVRSVVEAQPLGTGGAIANGVHQSGLQGEFLVTNADTWLASGMQVLAETPAPAIGVVRVADAARYGAVVLRDANVTAVTAFQEKKDSAGPGWINAGVYHLAAGLFSAWNGQPSSLERDLFPALAARGELRCCVMAGDFVDIGVPEDYRAFCRQVEAQGAHKGVI